MSGEMIPVTDAEMKHYKKTGELPVTEGKKFDGGKPPLTLISRRANDQEALVLAFGKQKYDAWNWSKGIAWSRVLDAAMRHISAFADGEDTDSETGLSHLAHARCCMGFLLDYEKEHPELDDRRPRTKPGALTPVRKDHTLLLGGK